MPYQFLAKFKVPLIIIGLIFLSYLLVNYNRQVAIEHFFFSGENLFDKEDEIKKDKADKIYSILNSTLANQEGKYAVYIKDLKSGEVFTLSPDEPMISASIYKLAVMYKTFAALTANEIQKDDVLTASQRYLDNLLVQNQEIVTYPNPASDAVVSYSVEEALRLTITISDNYSALLLAEKFGWDDIEQFLKDLGIGDFTLVSNAFPTATTYSTAQVLEKIYRGQAVSKQASNQMEKLLLSQTVNDRIPKYLQPNIKVAHKTGELDTLRHDAAIVFGQKSDYIFVFFTDTPDPDNASETIALLARDVFDALEQE